VNDGKATGSRWRWLDAFRKRLGLDRLIPVEHAERFHRAIPGSALIVYPGVGHLPMEEIPERSAADASRFLLSALGKAPPSRSENRR
jgi:hypothetical protein